jgi:two-component system sensor kinase FixL
MVLPVRGSSQRPVGRRSAIRRPPTGFSATGVICDRRINHGPEYGRRFAVTLFEGRALTKDRTELRVPSLLAEELSLLIDGATNYAIYMLDPDGLVTIWNRGAERIKGWNASEIVGRHFALFYPPDGIANDKPRQDLEAASLRGRLEEESWQIRRDGSEFLASTTTTALYDPSGALRGFGKVVRDITDEKAAEMALARREQHLRSILETVPDAMVVIDEFGTISSFSAAAERLFGHAQADVIGKNVSMLMPEPDEDRHAQYLDNYRRTGEKKVINKLRLVTGRRRNGETFPLELSVGEALSGGQRIFTGFVRDLTERRRTEQAMTDLQADLIRVSRVSAMGTMASTLAHELNQPLTAIVNYLETTHDLLLRPDTPTIGVVRDALAEASRQALRAGQIVRRLREFVAHGVVERHAELLAPLIHDAVSFGTIGARELGIEIAIALGDGEDRVFVDRVQIQQVLVNLLRNAIQATTGATRRAISITTAHRTDDMIEVVITDSGQGIAPDFAARLFEAFASTKAEGMGLGLSISRTIVEAHGGRIWMTNAIGGGSAFHFTLLRMRNADNE